MYSRKNEFVCIHGSIKIVISVSGLKNIYLILSIFAECYWTYFYVNYIVWNVYHQFFYDFYRAIKL